MTFKVTLRARSGHVPDYYVTMETLPVIMSRVRIAVLALVLAFATLSARESIAQGHRADTLMVSNLEELLDAVRLANPTLRAASLGAEALDQRPEQVGALPDPTFGLGLQPIPLVTARGSQRSQWQFQQAFPFPGKLGLRADAAAWSARTAEANVGTLEQNLVERTKHLYFDLSRILRQETLVLEFQQSLRNYEAVAQTRYEVGTGMQQAILKAQLERNALSNRLLNLARLRRTALEGLSQLVNRPLGLSATAVGISTLPRVLLSAPEMNAIARENRPETEALSAALRRTETLIELAKKDWMPDFGVGLTYFDLTDGSVPASADGRNAIAIGISVRLPLQRGRLRSRLEETRLLSRQVTAQQEALETSFRTEIADLVYRLEREQEQLNLFADALIPQARTTLAATLSAYTTGRTGFLDLLDADRMLFDLRWSEEATQNALLKAGASLERALGIDRLSDLNQ
jgi:outer membrane protein, heavy metal efflux system